MIQPVLDIRNLVKVYRDGVTALRDVSMTVRPGGFVALLGPNGAGKTTLINSIVGNVRLTSGSISVCGHDTEEEPFAVKKLLGVVPQEVGFDIYFSVKEILQNQSGYFGISHNDAYIQELLQELSLSEKKDTNNRQLSGGMKRRLLIAKALVHKPTLLILDEPTAGVDLELRLSLYTYLEKIHKQGTTIILTTHYLEEAERLCDRIVVINQGTVVADGDKKTLIRSLAKNTEVTIDFPAITDTIRDSFATFVPKIAGNSLVFRVEKTEVPPLLALLESRHIPFTDFTVKEARLEDVFLNLVS